MLEKEGGLTIADKGDCVAGHSLGEYTALAAVGAFRLADTAKLLKLRGQAMQAAVPVGEGAMCALLGADVEKAQKLADAAAEGEVCQVANDNDPGQVVLSGHRGAIERAVALVKEFEIKRGVILPVSAPFHCDLMAPAAEAMAEGAGGHAAGRAAAAALCQFHRHRGQRSRRRARAAGEASVRPGALARKHHRDERSRCYPFHGTGRQGGRPDDWAHGGGRHCDQRGYDGRHRSSGEGDRLNGFWGRALAGLSALLLASSSAAFAAEESLDCMAGAYDAKQQARIEKLSAPGFSLVDGRKTTSQPPKWRRSPSKRGRYLLGAEWLVGRRALLRDALRDQPAFREGPTAGRGA